MLKKFKIIIFFASLFFGVFCHQNIYAQYSPEEITENFFTIFEEDMGAAVDYLFSTNKLIDPNQAGIKAIKEKMDMSRKLLGNYYGYEIVNIYYAGESYKKYVYSLKYERQPVKLTILFYCPDKIWKVQNINFQDDIDTEFKLNE